MHVVEDAPDVGAHLLPLVGAPVPAGLERGVDQDTQRDGYRSPEDAIAYVRDYRCGDVFGTNRYRGLRRGGERHVQRFGNERVE